MLIPVGQRVAKCCAWRLRFVNPGERLFFGIDENVGLRAGISDEVVQTATVKGKRVELFNGDAALVFDDAFEPAIDVAHAGDDATAEFVLRADDKLIRIFHPYARLKRRNAADAGNHAAAYAA